MQSQSRSPSMLPQHAASNGQGSGARIQQGSAQRSETSRSNGQRSSKAPAKDMEAIRKQLREAQDVSKKKFGEMIKNKDKEKEVTISSDTLHKARKAPELSANQSMQARTIYANPDGTPYDANQVTDNSSQNHLSIPRSKLAEEWGNENDDPGDAETASIDSTTPMQQGKLPDKLDGGPKLARLGWDNNASLPRIDWHTEPTFNNSSTSFLNAFYRWLDDVCAKTMSSERPSSPRQSLDPRFVPNPNFHADGLSLVPIEMLVIQAGQEPLYGYTIVDAEEFGDHSREFVKDDWEDWGKIDPNDNENAEHWEETAEMLCHNLNAHWAKERADKLRTAQRNRIHAASISYATEVQQNAMVPKANIYIRPAVRTDLDQILYIFNSYVEDHARTSELEKVQVVEMHDRLNDCENERLPFLVAILKDFKSTRNTAARTTNTERVVGYGLATDFCLPDRAEKYTAELELYVHKEWVRKKVGSCLIDKLLEVCDPGYLRRQGYFFHSDDPSRYYPGGNRDLLSLVFVIRYYRDRDEREMEGIKKWLADFDFKERGVLERVGIKKGKITNMAYLVRHTAWEPSGS